MCVCVCVCDANPAQKFVYHISHLTHCCVSYISFDPLQAAGQRQRDANPAQKLRVSYIYICVYHIVACIIHLTCTEALKSLGSTFNFFFFSSFFFFPFLLRRSQISRKYFIFFSFFPPFFPAQEALKSYCPSAIYYIKPLQEVLSTFQNSTPTLNPKPVYYTTPL